MKVPTHTKKSRSTLGDCVGPLGPATIPPWLWPPAEAPDREVTEDAEAVPHASVCICLDLDIELVFVPFLESLAFIAIYPTFFLNRFTPTSRNEVFGVGRFPTGTHLHQLQHLGKQQFRWGEGMFC